MKKNLLLLFLAFQSLLFTQASAQPGQEPVVEKTSVVVPQTVPRFKFGQDSFQNFITVHQIYPDSAVDQDISGEVGVTFIVTETGAVTNIRISDKVHPLLDKEAIRLIGLTDKMWIPGKKSGKPIKSFCKINIVFELDEENFPEAPVYSEVDTVPQYSGGMALLEAIINDSLVFPDDGMGCVVTDLLLTFIVEADSSISNIVVSGGECCWASCQRQVQRLVQLTHGKWVPGRKNGKAVRTRMKMPVAIHPDE